MKIAITLIPGALLFATGALAQDVPDNPDPAHAEPQQVDSADIPPADDAPADPAVHEFSDDEIASFVAAATAIRRLQEDPALDDAARRAEAEAIVAQHGLDRDTYNAIGVAAQSDPAVAQRVQLAIAQTAENGDS